MKKIFLLILIFISFKSFGQFPATQGMGTVNTRIQVNGALDARKGMINGIYADTTAANTDYIDYYTGAQIYTRSDGNFWIRDTLPMRWTRMGRYSEVSNSLFARQDGKNNSGGNLYFSNSSQNFSIDSINNATFNIGNNFVVSDLVGSLPRLYINDTYSSLLSPNQELADGSQFTAYDDTLLLALNSTSSKLLINNLNAGAGTDSVLMWNATTKRVGYRNVSAIGSSSNFANTNLTFTADRTHAMAGNSLKLSSSGAEQFFIEPDSRYRFGAIDDGGGAAMGLDIDNVAGTVKLGSLTGFTGLSLSALPTRYIKLDIAGTNYFHLDGSGNFFLPQGLAAGASTDSVVVIDPSTGQLKKRNASSFGYTNLTQFVAQTNWTTGYIDGSGDYIELPIGSSGKVLTSNGASSAPSWETPTGGGLTVGTTPIASGTAGRILFEGSGNELQEDAGLTYNQTGNIFQVTGEAGSSAQMIVENINAGSAAYFNFRYAGNNTAFVMLPNYDLSLTPAGNSELMTWKQSTFNVGIDNIAPASALKLDVNGAIGAESFMRLKDISAPSTPASSYGAEYVRDDSLRFKNDAGTEFTLGRVAGGTGSNLSWDGANHQVDIDGGGTSATIPYATAAGDGLVNTATQTFAGIKTFNDPISSVSSVAAGSVLLAGTGYIQVPTLAGIGTPSAGLGFIWEKTSDKKLYFSNDAGTVYDLTSGAVGGSGTVSNQTVNTTAVGNVGAGEDNLITYSLPAGKLAANGDYIEFTMSFTFAANANSKQIKVYFGSQQLYASGAQLQNDGTLTVTGRIIRTGAATQIATIEVATDAGLFTDVAKYTLPTETLSGAITLKATGEAVSNDDISQKVLTVKYINAN